MCYLWLIYSGWSSYGQWVVHSIIGEGATTAPIFYGREFTMRDLFKLLCGFWSSFPDAKVFHLWILILLHIDHGVVSVYVSWWRQPRCLIWMEMTRYWSNKLHCLISLRYLRYVCDLFIHYWFYILEIITIIREITKNHWFTVSQQITKINK